VSAPTCSPLREHRSLEVVPGRPRRALLGEQSREERSREGGSRCPGLESKARRTQGCRGARFPAVPGTDVVTQPHPTGASPCPGTAVCISSGVTSAGRERLLRRVARSNQVRC